MFMIKNYHLFVNRNLSMRRKKTGSIRAECFPFTHSDYLPVFGVLVSELMMHSTASRVSPSLCFIQVEIE